MGRHPSHSNHNNLRHNENGRLVECAQHLIQLNPFVGFSLLISRSFTYLCLFGVHVKAPRLQNAVALASAIAIYSISYTHSRSTSSSPCCLSDKQAIQQHIVRRPFIVCAKIINKRNRSRPSLVYIVNEARTLIWSGNRWLIDAESVVITRCRTLLMRSSEYNKSSLYTKDNYVHN